MGKPLSLDIRERVVALVDEGLSCHEAARRLRISAACAVRIMPRKKWMGVVMPAPQGRPRRSKLDAVSGWLKARVEAAPDITMPKLTAPWVLDGPTLGRFGIAKSPAGQWMNRAAFDVYIETQLARPCCPGMWSLPTTCRRTNPQRCRPI
jgi:paired box domain-containing protein